MPLQVVGYVAIGFPLGGMANLVLRSRAHWSELELSPVPKLVLQGTRDSYSPLSTLRDLMMQYNEHEPTPGPMELKVCGSAHLVLHTCVPAAVPGSTVGLLRGSREGLPVMLAVLWLTASENSCLEPSPNLNVSYLLAYYHAHLDSTACICVLYCAVLYRQSMALTTSSKGSGR